MYYRFTATDQRQKKRTNLALLTLASNSKLSHLLLVTRRAILRRVPAIIKRLPLSPLFGVGESSILRLPLPPYSPRPPLPPRPLSLARSA